MYRLLLLSVLYTCRNNLKWNYIEKSNRYIRISQWELLLLLLLQPFSGPFSGTTWMSWYHSPTHTYPDHQSSFICFLHLLQSIASSLFNLRTTSLQVLFGIPLGLEPSTSHSIHFFTQSLSFFHNTCPYRRNQFCCSIKIMPSNPSLSLNSLLGMLSFILTSHIHLITLISARWSATSFSFLTADEKLTIN